MLVESSTSKRGHGGQQGTISLSQILQNQPGGLTDTGQIKNCSIFSKSYAINIFLQSHYITGSLLHIFFKDYIFLNLKAVRCLACYMCNVR